MEAKMEATHACGIAFVPGAAWWPMRELPSLRFLGGTWLVTLGNYGDARFVRNVGAVVDDFGTLVPVQPDRSLA
jgi:hypothetical protein